MTLVSAVIWTITGLGLAVLIFLSQRWTVDLIHPEHVKLSKWLVIGGAFIRWMIISLVFIAALSSSMGELLILFFTFLFCRLLILFIWQSRLSSEQSRLHSTKVS